jgi:hypothetical protein
MDKLLRLLLIAGVVSIPPTSVAADTPPSGGGRLFRCELQGKVTYSDTACEQSPTKIEIVTGSLNTSDATPVETTRTTESNPSAIRFKPPVQNHADRGSIAQQQASNKAGCELSAVRLEGLRKQGRHGRRAITDRKESASTAKARDQKIADLERDRRRSGCR